MNEDVIKQVMKAFNAFDDEHRDAERMKPIEIDGVKYSFAVEEESSWEDDGRGKYFFQHIRLQLIAVDSEWNVLERFDVYFTQNVSRTGSYYTDWYYSYDPIVRVKRIEKLIPEQIIPAHTVVEWEEVKDEDMSDSIDCKASV